MLYWHDIKIFYILPKLSKVYANYEIKITYKIHIQNITETLQVYMQVHRVIISISTNKLMIYMCVWNGIVRYGMVSYSIVSYCMERYSKVWYGVV